MCLVAPQHVESSCTRDWTHVPCVGRCILNHRPTSEVQAPFIMAGGWYPWSSGVSVFICLAGCSRKSLTCIWDVLLWWWCEIEWWPEFIGPQRGGFHIVLALHSFRVPWIQVGHFVDTALILAISQLALIGWWELIKFSEILWPSCQVETIKMQVKCKNN